MAAHSHYWHVAVLSGAIALSGCLVESAPDKQPPVRTQPRLLLDRAVPPVYQLMEHAPQETVEFTIPVHPEDQGEEYVAIRYWNYKLEGERYDRTVEKAPQADTITFSVNMRDEAGCYQYTMFVTREENLNVFDLLPDEFRDSAMVTWWVLITGPNSEEPLLSDCPAARPPEPRAEE